MVAIVAFLVLSNVVNVTLHALGLLMYGGGPSKTSTVKSVAIPPQKMDVLCARDNPERSRFELACDQLEKSKSRSGQ